MFLREREIYLLRIEDAKSTRNSMQSISIKSSFDRHVLQSLVEFEELDFSDLADQVPMKLYRLGSLE